MPTTASPQKTLAIVQRTALLLVAVTVTAATLVMSLTASVASAKVSAHHRSRLSGRIEFRANRRRGPVAHAASTTSTGNQNWRPAPANGFTPLSDQQAAAGVIPTAENRPQNAGSNRYMPTAAQLQTFRSATNNLGQSVLVANPYNRYVTGHYTGTTDEIIQWAAQKWGIPADVLRAEYVQESDWKMSQLGDLTTVTPAQYAQYPPQARVAGTDEVYESMGISQVKWTPNGSVGAGTEPLRWESTAFNVDYQAATVRFYYDDPGGARSDWGDSTYSPGQAWNSIGGWYEPYPWLNQGQLNYVNEVQSQLSARRWTKSGF